MGDGVAAVVKWLTWYCRCCKVTKCAQTIDRSGGKLVHGALNPKPRGRLLGLGLYTHHSNGNWHREPWLQALYFCGVIITDSSLNVIHMRNVDAWKPKKFRPPINFYFLENTEGIWSNEIFRISKKIKSAIFQRLIFSIGFFSSKMNAVCRDLFKNVKIWGVRNIFCPKNGFLFFKFDEDWRCQKNSDH